MYLRQATASQVVKLGPFLDDTDGKTQKTALTIANTDIKLTKAGSSEANKNSGGATHVANGRYYITLDATDTATVGLLEIDVHVSGALPVRRTMYVLEEAIYDAWFAASAVGYISNAPVNVTQFGGTNGTFSGGRPEVNTTHIEGSDATNQLAAAAQAPFVDHSGTAQAGAAGTITLATGATATDDYYNGAVVKIQSGTGAGQSRQITDYVGSTRVATVDSNWVTNPDSTSVYIVLGRVV